MEVRISMTSVSRENGLLTDILNRVMVTAKKEECLQAGQPTRLCRFPKKELVKNDGLH